MTEKKIERRDFLKAVGIGATAAVCGCGDKVGSVPKETPQSSGTSAPKPPPPATPATPSTSSPGATPSPGGAKKPNVLFITTDDLNWDSVGANGCKVQDITPNIDRLASEGVRFEHAHVNIAVCQPCRGVLATGRYPHRNGIKGFQHTSLRIPTIMQTLKDAGYLTGVMSKVAHSTPHEDFEWDFTATKDDTCHGRDPARFFELTSQFLARSKSEGRPFYLMANSQDPHRPFFGAEKVKQFSCDPPMPSPSRTYRPDEVPVPGFLPDIPKVKQEIASYFNSVRRADDTVGEILRAIKESGEEENTIVVFISDHGMPFPFGKANCYPQSTRVPWIVRWPGVASPGTVDRDHMISGIDFFPSVLDAVGLPIPEGLDGRSFVPLLKGEDQDNRDMVFTQFHRTAKKDAFPMRAVQDKEYCYIFNPWSDGDRAYKAESMAGITFKAMKAAGETDPAIAARVELYKYRVLEELYDLKTDPNCLTNLVGDKTHRQALKRMRNALGTWMETTGDKALQCFRKRGRKKVCKKFVQSEQKEAKAQRKSKSL